MDQLATYRNGFAALTFLAHSFSWATDFETIVTAPRPQREPHIISLEKPADKSVPSYPWLSLAQMGVSSAPNAGALSFGDIRYRGFSSPQLRMSIDDIDLSDGGSGLLDLYDLPLFAASEVNLKPGASSGALGGSLQLALNVPSNAFARARGSFGSSAFGLTDITAASGDLQGVRTLMGLQLGSTRGDFSYLGAKRQNNDQGRILGFLKTKAALKSADLDLLLFARHHEGGLAGPATFPTPNARLLSQKFLFGSGLSWQLGSFPMSVKWSTRFDRNETSEMNHEGSDNVGFIVNDLTLKAERRVAYADFLSSVQTTLASSQLLDGRYRRLSNRWEIAFDTAPFEFWSMRFRRSANLQLHSDLGWFLGFSTNIYATPVKPITVGIRFGKNVRPPTLSEMFAPQGLILGNRDLHPEKVYDGAVYLNYDYNSQLKTSVDVFYSHLSEAIFYVNKNSFLIEPINAESVQRAGLGASLTFEPHEIFQVTSRMDFLFSRISMTGAPLPGATPLSGTINTRVGKEKGIFGRLSTVVNAGSSSNLFGTLKTDPYALINASIHVPLLSQARLSLSVTNIADVTWARNAYHYPMPGREFFFTLETHT